MINRVINWKQSSTQARLDATMQDYVQCAEDWTDFMQTRVYTVGLRRLEAILIRKERLSCRRTLWRLHESCRAERVFHFIQTSKFMDDRLRRSALRLVLEQLRSAVYGREGLFQSRIAMWRERVRQHRNSASRKSEMSHGLGLCRVLVDRKQRARYARAVNEWKTGMLAVTYAALESRLWTRNEECEELARNAESIMVQQRLRHREECQRREAMAMWRVAERIQRDCMKRSLDVWTLSAAVGLGGSSVKDHTASIEKLGRRCRLMKGSHAARLFAALASRTWSRRAAKALLGWLQNLHASHSSESRSHMLRVIELEEEIVLLERDIDHADQLAQHQTIRIAESQGEELVKLRVELHRLLAMQRVVEGVDVVMTQITSPQLEHAMPLASEPPKVYTLHSLLASLAELEDAMDDVGVEEGMLKHVAVMMDGKSLFIPTPPHCNHTVAAMTQGSRQHESYICMRYTGNRMI